LEKFRQRWLNHVLEAEIFQERFGVGLDRFEANQVTALEIGDGVLMRVHSQVNPMGESLTVLGYSIGSI